MVEKPTAGASEVDVAPQQSGTVAKGQASGQGQPAEPFEGADTEITAQVVTTLTRSTWERRKDTWNREHPDHPYATAEAFKAAFQAAAARTGYPPAETVDSILKGP